MSSESEEFRRDLLGLVDTFVSDTAEVKTMMVRLTDQIESMEDDLRYMNKVVRDGNGRPPLITRMELLEQRLSQIETLITKVADRWWQIIVAATPGLLALILGTGMV
jgi:ppGpp synthetase/RelA/SpoT-type nucleotidyltranferase